MAKEASEVTVETRPKDKVINSKPITIEDHKKSKTNITNSSKVKEIISFIYEDASGNKTTREITAYNIDDEYIKGFCHLRGEIRTFRKDRIVSFINKQSVEKLSTKTPTKKPRSTTETKTEILFTGFSAAKRADLEKVATNNSFKVRKSVTKNLAILCCGPNAGPKKLEESKEKGVEILTEDDFNKLIQTGELPVAS
ncbi:BRCT domain-containing protein [Halobacteriovorax sp. GFR7]|uniref:BRCT domain-containing protein n=1 Tax=unclassified Halobacteriovorax TaxID=2639665 RepID=UPI003D950E28